MKQVGLNDPMICVMIPEAKMCSCLTLISGNLVHVHKNEKYTGKFLLSGRIIYSLVPTTFSFALDLESAEN